ncbi:MULTISPECIES: Crp/Fnr family transcriptional regulator [Listeria]|uniref:Crp/Fnr family transcriptional regulator n=1 Tax=Listeria TaxID=1637 RepID=UPI000B58C703|nr:MULTISPECIES: Crp/Fnr family transcriptional regulator [Listeria]
MYSKSFLDDFTNFDYVMKILKSNPQFNHKCHQIALKTGLSIEVSFKKNKVYFIQEGYTKLSNLNGKRPVFILISKRGEFPFLIAQNDLSDELAEISALTDCILWEIDLDYLNDVLLTEDPRNFVLLNYHIKLSRNSMIQLIMDSFPSEERIYYILHFLANKFGIRNADGSIDLPSFVTYEKLGELASVSLSHTSNIIKTLQKQNIISIRKKQWVIHTLQDIPIVIPYTFDRWV